MKSELREDKSRRKIKYEIKKSLNKLFLIAGAPNCSVQFINQCIKSIIIDFKQTISFYASLKSALNRDDTENSVKS